MASTAAVAEEPAEDSWWGDLRDAAVRFAVASAVFAAVSEGGQWVRRALRSRRGSKRAGGPIAALVLRPSLRFGAWAALFGLSYRAVRRLTRSSALAGAAAGATTAMLLPLRGTLADPVELALHAAVRAGEHLLQVGVDRGYCHPVLGEHGGTLLFVAACTEIMFAWFYEPDALPRTYNHWITRMADMDSRLLDALRALRVGRVRYGQQSPVLRQYCMDHHLDPTRADLAHGFIPCSVVHPHHGGACLSHFAERVTHGAVAAMSLYVPVHALAAAVVMLGRRANRERTHHDDGSSSSSSMTGSIIPTLPPRAAEPALSTEAVPSVRSGSSSTHASPEAPLLRDVALRVLFGAMRSSAFLGLFIGLAWYGVCLTRNSLHDDWTAGPLLGSFLSGWSVLLEPPQRRMELACYVLPRALHSVWFRLKRAGLARDVPYFHVLLSMLACAILASAWEQRSTSLRPMVRAILGLMLRNSPR